MLVGIIVIEIRQLTWMKMARLNGSVFGHNLPACKYAKTRYVWDLFNGISFSLFSIVSRFLMSNWGSSLILFRVFQDHIQVNWDEIVRILIRF